MTNEMKACNVEKLTDGGRVSSPCGSTDNVVECMECGDVICAAHRDDCPVFNVKGKPVCEDCMPSGPDYPLWDDRTMDSLTIVELLNIANGGYPDGYLASFYDTQTGDRVESLGDGLAEFIVTELVETFDDQNSRDDQLNEAVAKMESAVRDLQGVIDALESACIGDRGDDRIAANDQKSVTTLQVAHTKDEDCTVVYGVCTTCHVDHSGGCEVCGGRGFHKADCPFMTEGLQ